MADTQLDEQEVCSLPLSWETHSCGSHQWPPCALASSGAGIREGAGTGVFGEGATREYELRVRVEVGSRLSTHRSALPHAHTRVLAA